MEWFYTSEPLWWILFGSRLIIYGCIITFMLSCCLFLIGKEIRRCYKNKVPWYFDVPVKSKGNPELKRNYQDSLLWVTTASHPLTAPLKSKMTGLTGPKKDQLSNLFNTPKSVGTLEELLIMP